MRPHAGRVHGPGPVAIDPFPACLALGFVAGAMNALAGGGPIIVVAALAAMGWAADIASLSSTVALLPGQIVAGWRGAAGLATAVPPQVRRLLVAVALLGGAAGAALLLVTPTAVFAAMLPALVLVATSLYWRSSRARIAEPDAPPARSPGRGMAALFIPLSVYGGFYGGGNSFLVLALLAHARVPPRAAAHAKNLLILLVNAAATLVFLGSGQVSATLAVPLAIGALGGSAAGARMIDRIAVARLRMLVVATGLLLAGWLALRP